MKINLKTIKYNKMGISPVIATVIIVAVTITVAVAISYWMGGIAGLYTRFEKIEISYATVEYDSNNKYWVIILKVKNTGSADARIDDILLNGISIFNVKNNDGKYANYNTSSSNIPTIQPSNNPVSSVSILVNSGGEIYIAIALPDSAKMGSSIASSGLSLEIKLHTAAGKDYPKIITLP